jgi:hypothetical protein
MENNADIESRSDIEASQLSRADGTSKAGQILRQLKHYD